MKFFKTKLIVLLFTILFSTIIVLLLKPILTTNSLIFPYSIHQFDIAKEYPDVWLYIKIVYCINLFSTIFLIINSIYIHFKFNKINTNKQDLKSIEYTVPTKVENKNLFNLLIGTNSKNNQKIYIPEKGLYQNILVTGTIGSGKTSSVMYPLLNQIIQSKYPEFGMLILDVKGNFFKQVLNYANMYNRLSDILVIGLDSNIKYNPLDKPHLNPSVLANRLKTILELFSPNNSESYWLDKVQDLLCESIKLCRLYNNGYVTFTEIHNLISFDNYYTSKLEILRKCFYLAYSHRKIFIIYTRLYHFLKMNSQV